MIYFYPHSYLRDRQLDTIRQWPVEQVVNRAEIYKRKGSRVGADEARAERFPLSWKQIFPLCNVKLRPDNLADDTVVYLWGGLVSSGAFIVDLDNPWSLVGYNLRAMFLYRQLIKKILLSDRCVEIRCMSRACRESVKKLFGDRAYQKAEVHYPKVKPVVTVNAPVADEYSRFVFVGTQFEIKGGAALLRAFHRVYNRHKGKCRLEVITHLPDRYRKMADSCNGITIHEAGFSRDEIHSRFLQKADVLVLPTYVDSFGMIALEALANGLAIIATDVYALGEMVEDGKNGELLTPPISIWDGVMPSKTYYRLADIHKIIGETDVSSFEVELETSIERFVIDQNWKNRAKQASIELMSERFAC